MELNGWLNSLTDRLFGETKPSREYVRGYNSCVDAGNSCLDALRADRVEIDAAHFAALELSAVEYRNAMVRALRKARHDSEDLRENRRRSQQ